MEQIDNARYGGYIWMSDRQEPSVINPDEEFGMTFCDADNPFVVEGNLWDAAAEVSIMIKYVDGKYIVRRTVVTEECRRSATGREFLPHRMNGVRKLKFLQCWDEEEDPLCENMVTLQPGKLVFVGFIK